MGGLVRLGFSALLSWSSCPPLESESNPFCRPAGHDRHFLVMFESVLGWGRVEGKRGTRGVINKPKRKKTHRQHKNERRSIISGPPLQDAPQFSTRNNLLPRKCPFLGFWNRVRSVIPNRPQICCPWSLGGPPPTALLVVTWAVPRTAELLTGDFGPSSRRRGRSCKRRRAESSTS